MLHGKGREGCRGKKSSSTIWEDFSKDLLEHLFPYELRKAKGEEFVNLQ